MSKARWVMTFETVETDIVKVKTALDAFVDVIAIEPRERPLGIGVKVVRNKREPNGPSVTSAPRNMTVKCEPCAAGTCASCLYPMDCPCTEPMHNMVVLEAMGLA